MGELKKALKGGTVGLLSVLGGTLLSMAGVLVYGYFSVKIGVIVIVFGVVIFFYGFIKLGAQYFQGKKDYR